LKNTGISPLIEKYSEVFEKDSTSRVFAPLAEGYRQAGLIEKAMSILKIGIRHNPAYLQGYITLGNCYFDVGEFNLAYSTLRPLISDNRDNIRLQKLFASSCVEIGHNDEALESYKYLLFLNPKDEEVSKAVRELESKDTEEDLIIVPDNTERFDLEEIEVRPEKVKSSLDEWIKVDLDKNEIKTDTKIDLKETDKKEVTNNWEMEKPSAPLKIVNVEEKENVSEPVITHSLVDLYINQGHILKAKELLNKIIELNPNEVSSIKKLEEIKSIESKTRVEVEAEEEGHQRLLDSLDEKLGGEDGSTSSSVEELQKFLDAIQKHAEIRKNSQL
tara:strand:+ start:467957 stop:468949 length:993 start_codon:yes stop_codon:yes gene_type:complete